MVKFRIQKFRVIPNANTRGIAFLGLLALLHERNFRLHNDPAKSTDGVLDFIKVPTSGNGKVKEKRSLLDQKQRGFVRGFDTHGQYWPALVEGKIGRLFSIY